MKPDRAREMLHDCLGAKGSVIPGKHFRDELAKEELSMLDAWHVLRSGLIFDAPEVDIKTGEWKYRIEGRVPDGKTIGIVFSFKQVDMAFLITVFSIQAK